MRIGITDTLNDDKYDQYVRWIHSNDGSVEIVKLSHRLDNKLEVASIDGLIITGGGDVHPKYYGKESELHKASYVNEERDEFEFAVIEQALDAEIPILGVCRGMQVMNVCLGGSLIVDLVSAGFYDHVSVSDNNVRKHKISITSNTLLYALTNTDETEVNYFHHQGIERLGKGLISSAVSADNLIEACEWAMKENMPFLLLVQWHPERLVESFLSQKIARIFLREVQQVKTH